MVVLGSKKRKKSVTTFRRTCRVLDVDHAESWEEGKVKGEPKNKKMEIE